MSLHRTLLTLGAATVALVLGTVAASAATAYASSTVNVRTGPGPGYAVVDVLRRGERVDVDYCRGSWCKVSKSGPDGWVSANYLTQDHYDRHDRYDRYDRYDDRIYIERPRFHRPFRPYFGNQVCLGGPNASFCITD